MDHGRTLDEGNGPKRSRNSGLRGRPGYSSRLRALGTWILEVSFTERKSGAEGEGEGGSNVMVKELREVTLVRLDVDNATACFSVVT